MGTHMRILSESYPIKTNMTGFRWFPKVLASLSALDESSLNIGRVKSFLLFNPVSLSDTRHAQDMFHDCSIGTIHSERWFYSCL